MSQKTVFQISLRVEADDEEEALLVADYILEQAINMTGSVIDVVEIENVKESIGLSSKDGQVAI